VSGEAGLFAVKPRSFLATPATEVQIDVHHDARGIAALVVLEQQQFRTGVEVARLAQQIFGVAGPSFDHGTGARECEP
jgi:hypothetical protein